MPSFSHSSETDTDSLLRYLQESFTFGVKGKPNTAIIGGGGRGVERVVVLGGARWHKPQSPVPPHLATCCGPPLVFSYWKDIDKLRVKPKD